MSIFGSIEPQTPVSRQAIERALTGDPVAAVVRAWTTEGPRPMWHRAMVNRVRRQMPVLGAALDRLAKEHPTDG